MKLAFFIATVCALLVACALPPQPLSERHVIEKPSATQALLPPSLRPIRLPGMPPAPTPRAAQEVFSVVVNDVPIKTLLFALARDNKLNVDIHPSVGGKVTLNATDQTLPQLLERIAAQSDIRYEISGNLLRVQPDTPYLQNYSIDYVNLLRQSTNQVSVSASLGGSTATSSGTSDSSIKSSSDNKFWDTLISNVCQIVITANQSRNQRDEQAERQRTQDRDDRLKVALELTKAVQGAPTAGPSSAGAAVSPQQSSIGSAGAADLMRQVLNVTNTQNAAVSSVTNAPATNATAAGTASTGGAAASGTTTQATAATNTTSCGTTAGAVTSATTNPLMVNRESGIVGINTTSKGHERVRAFIDRVMAGARRQVLIEASVVEVQLSANSQSGINWSQIVTSGAARGLTVNLTASSALSSTNAATISFARTGTGIGDISAAVSLLESFGSTKVLSSPKLSVINNQSAIIKVIDNYVYVTLAYTPATLTSTGAIASPAAYTSTINTVPVGFVMTVTPQISDSGEVTLNVHPSITRVISTIVDPNPVLINATPRITNLIPVVQSRELESILRVQSGEIAVLGGLMQESNTGAEQGLPGLNRVSVAGAMTGSRSEARAKTELVVFMRPIVIRDASINGDYREYKSQLPTSTFFHGTMTDSWDVKK